MTFAVAADAYDHFMGRYSSRLAPVFADFAGVGAGMRVVDVGCGPGALTRELVDRVGAENVVAADPSPPFVAAVRERFPAVDVHEAPAEALPFEDRIFDAALAQLVVHFMSDPAAGIAEMARVTRPGGVVAACVWDVAHASPLTPFWQAVRAGDPDAGDSDRPGTLEGDLVERFRAAGFRDVAGAALEVSLVHDTFEDWWEPFTLGVGPAGSYASRLTDDERAAVRERCRAALGEGPFAIPSRAWAARGAVV